MEKRLCIISVIVEEKESVSKVNEVLSEFGDEIIGRMGLPLKERGVSAITLVADSDMKILNSVTGKLGMLKGISAKTLMR